MRKQLILLAAISLCGLSLESSLAADAKVSGRVILDGAPLAEGKITIYFDNGQFVGSKIKDGKFVIDQISSGTYKVTVEGKGVPHKFANDEASVLTFSVRPGSNTFDLALEGAKAAAPSKVQNDLAEVLMNGPDSPKALAIVLKDPDKYSALVLFYAAAVALKEKQLEDAGFLFYAARIRAQFDKECFTAKGKGGDSPFTLYQALAFQIGNTLNPEIMAEPKVFAKAVERLKKYNPTAPDDYEPGYDFTERKSVEVALEATKAFRAGYVSSLGDLATLLSDETYFNAFRVVQSYNQSEADKRPTKSENDVAIETLKRIEKEKGLKGAFAK